MKGPILFIAAVFACPGDGFATTSEYLYENY